MRPLRGERVLGSEPDALPPIKIAAYEHTTEELRASEGQFRAVVANIPGVVYRCACDSAWTMRFMSDCVQELTGHPVTDFIANRVRTWGSVIHPEDRPQVIEAIEEALEEGSPYSVQYRLTHADGASRWVAEHGRAVLGERGERLWLDGVILDVTESKLAEAALRESEERFRTLFESSPHGMEVVDRDGRLLQANAAFEELLGYDKEELGRLQVADFTHPDDLAADRELFHGLIEGKHPFYQIEKRYWRKDGTAACVHVTAFALPDPSGKPQFTIGFVEDITERKALEERLRQSQQMEAIGQLAGGIAHDFNNLLTAIGSYCHLAQGALRERGDEQLQRTVEGIQGATEQAAQLTQQLLAFSRRKVLAPEVLNPNEVVAEQVPMLERLLGADIEVRLALEPQLGAVKIDPGLLRQVLMNLAVNARDAMPDGGVITIKTQNLELDKAATTREPLSGPHVLLAISDTGTGIEDAILVRIFEPFFTTKEQGKGTGLGLATVIGIAEQSGGGVSVDSEQGEGTTFKVYLPRLAAAAAMEPPATVGAHRPAGREHILFVEDNDAVREPVSELLQQFGYTVTVAAHPDEALEQAQTDDAIDLLVTDIVMPTMNGRQLAELLLVRRPQLKVLYISGYTDDAVIARGVIDREMAFLQKPFGADQLAQKIRGLLDA